MSTWRNRAPKRDITLHRGEDIDVAARFLRKGEPWIPPTGTTAWFRAWLPTPLDIEVAITDGTLTAHIEAATADTIPDGTEFWFYVKTPETPNGNPKVITTGKVKRVDPA